MKKGLYIVGLLGFLLVFGACEKIGDRPVPADDPFSTYEDTNDQNRSQTSKSGPDYGVRGNEIIPVGPSDGGGGITDPDEDEDFDGIVDPDEDEDFDKDGDGK